MTTADYTSLARRLAEPSTLITDLTDYGDYLRDATELKGSPSAIVFATSTTDVVEAVRFAREHKIPIVPRGAGTGLSGGCVPSSNALIISTERIANLNITPEVNMANCGPGVITKQLQDEAAKFGLTYPPDPASYDESTLGGNVAEGAGGLRCKRYGVTKDYILGLEAVTLDGQILRTGIYGEGQGFLIGDILIASEGTLAIVTEIAVQLIPTIQRGTTILAGFDHPEDAARTVATIIGSGMIPNVLEFIDGDAAACSNAYEKTEGLESVGALLLIETPPDEIEAHTAAIRRFCDSSRCSLLRIEPDPIRAEALWKVRRNISKAVKAMGIVRVSEDVAVPVTKFAELVEFVAELNASSPLRINSFGHAGDGNLHAGFLSLTGSEEDMAAIEACVDRLMRRTLELGGTLTGEHGIGLVKRRYLELEFDQPTLKAMRSIKDVFDPLGLLNPHKIFSD